MRSLGVGSRGCSAKGTRMVKKRKGDGAMPGKLAKLATRPKKSKIGHALVVEDDAILALTIEQALEDAGAARISICAGANEALEVLREAKPDVVILDVHLADSDEGWEIAELLSAIGPKPPKIIFSTGAPQDIPEDIAELGPVLEKPYDPEKLVELASHPRRGGLLDLLRRGKAKA